MICFTDGEKIKGFDRIAECFFQQNFGAVGKSDLELILFSVLLDHCRGHNVPCDDYVLSGMLGITQQRVRNLKVKCHLRYPVVYDWREELARLAQNARYSQDERYITISLNNPVLAIEVEHFVEEKGGMVDYSPNPKLLKMPTCDFAALMVEIGLEKNEAKVWEKLQMAYQRENQGAEMITRESWKKRLTKGTVDFARDVISDVITNVLTGT